MPKPTSTAAAARPYHHGDLRRTLIDAAVELVTEKQDWAFSLREVARHAGVSHNAPYNHFADKNELLAAMAAAGFERLKGRMLAASDRAQSAAAALLLSARAYVESGVENPALYRLMFGPALAPGTVPQAAIARGAGVKARAVLEQIILRGASAGEFAIAADRSKELELHTLFAWSAVHGLTMLVIDNLNPVELPLRRLVDRLVHSVLEGLSPR
jgi:AcrR family transcriptional regulator